MQLYKRVAELVHEQDEYTHRRVPSMSDFIIKITCGERSSDDTPHSNYWIGIPPIDGEEPFTIEANEQRSVFLRRDPDRPDKFIPGDQLTKEEETALCDLIPSPVPADI